MIQQIIKAGIRGILKLVNYAINIKSIVKHHRKLKRQHYTVDFINEGSILIHLPKVSTFEMILSVGINARRNIAFMKRPSAEVLLRKIIYELYQSNFINSKQSIIDIGC